MTSSLTETTLTDRYIAAAMQSLPEQQRTEVSRELRAAIMDAIDARLAQGQDHASAEASALTELGDPERLAASFSDRKLFLIGPDVFLTYWRILKQLLLFLVPPLAGLVFLGNLSEGELSLGEAIGIVVTIAVHVAFWTTLAFALAERYAVDKVRNMRAWSLDKLPDMSPRPISNSDVVGGIASSIGTIALMVIQTRRSFATNEGEDVQVLNPDLWSFWLPAIIVVLLCFIALEFVKFRVGHWTLTIAVANLILNAALGIPIVWLALNDRLINPELYVAVNWPEGAGSNGPLAVSIAVSVGLICLWDIVEGLYNALRNAGRLQAIG